MDLFNINISALNALYMEKEVSKDMMTGGYLNICSHHFVKIAHLRVWNQTLKVEYRFICMDIVLISGKVRPHLLHPNQKIPIISHLGPILLTWGNYDSSKDNLSHAQ